MVLAFVSVLPALAVTLYDAFDHRRRMHDRVSDQATQVAEAAVARQQLFVESIESRLAGLAAAHEVRDRDATGCNSFLADYVSRWPGSYALGLFEPDGRLRCHSAPDDAPLPHVTEAAARFARRVAADGRFTLGRYFRNPSNGSPFLVAGLPVKDSAGRVTGVLTVTREVRWLERFRREAVMPAGSILFLVAPTGELLARVPDDSGSAAPAAVPARLLEVLRTGEGEGEGEEGSAVEGMSVDGELRVHGFARLPGSPEFGGPYVVAGVSHTQTYAEANVALRDSLIRLAAITLLVLLVAATVGELLVLRRVRALLAATERVAAGDLDEHFTGLSRDGELGRIARGLARMTDALRSREAEAREALAALSRSEERYRAIVHGTSQIVWTTDAMGRLVEDQPSWRAVTGQTWEEIRGHGWLDAVHPDDRARVASEWGAALRELRPYTAEYRVRTASGEYRPYESHGCPVLEPGGSRVRDWVGFCVDITERRTAEEALRRAEEASLEGQKMEAIGRLAGGVAHDFNNLLTAVNSYAQFLLEDPALSEQHRSDVQEIRRAADRGSTLVRQLLAFGRRQPVHATVLDLGGVVTGMQEMLRRLLGAEYVLDVRCGAGVPPVLADAVQVEQVVLNLVINARDAMPGGGRITIETDVAPCPGEQASRRRGGCARLRVRDHGTGMDEATRARIFEPFFTTKGAGKGSGLGLATVYGVVRQAGGEVEVASTPGEGTSFTVHLPTADVAAAPSGAPEPDRRPGHPGEADAGGPDAGGPEAGGPEAGDPRTGAVAPPLTVARQPRAARILVADDEPTVRLAAGRALRRLGYEVLEAEDGVAALALAGPAAEEVDLVLSDVVMPRMNGVALAERLRALRPGLPVVLMSGYAPDLARRAELVLAGVPLVDKPFDVGHLTTLVGDLLAAAARPPTHTITEPTHR
ncbi:MAG TPA: ATP-binding protein [Gemmatimonadales bacterium]